MGWKGKGNVIWKSFFSPAWFISSACSRWTDSFVAFFVQGCYVCIVTGYCEGGDMWVHIWLTSWCVFSFALSKPPHKIQCPRATYNAVLDKDQGQDMIWAKQSESHMLLHHVLDEEMVSSQELYGMCNLWWGGLGAKVGAFSSTKSLYDVLVCRAEIIKKAHGQYFCEEVSFCSIQKIVSHD